MRILTLFVLIGIMALMFAGQAAYLSDLEYNTTRDIYNTTSSLNWNSSIGETVKSSINSNTDLLEYDINVERLGNVLGEFINFIGYSVTEIFKWGIEYGYNHPEHDMGFFLDFFIKILCILIIIALIPLVVPLIALVYLFFKGIYILIIKIRDWINKNERQKTKT